MVIGDICSSLAMSTGAPKKGYRDRRDPSWLGSSVQISGLGSLPIGSIYGIYANISIDIQCSKKI